MKKKKKNSPLQNRAHSWCAKESEHYFPSVYVENTYFEFHTEKFRENFDNDKPFYDDMIQEKKVMRIRNLENEILNVKVVLPQHELYQATSFSFFCKPQKFIIEKNSFYDLDIVLNLFGKVNLTSNLLFHLEFSYREKKKNENSEPIKHYFVCS